MVKKILFIAVSFLIEVVLLLVWLNIRTEISLAVYFFPIINIFALSLLFRKEKHLTKAMIALVLMIAFLFSQEIFSYLDTKLYYSDLGASVLKYFLSFISTFIPYIVYIIYNCVSHFTTVFIAYKKTRGQTS